MSNNPNPLVAPVAWQDFGRWCLTGQHGMRPIYLSTSPKGVLMDRDPVADRLIPLTPETPVAQELVRIINSHAEMVAALAEAAGYLASVRTDPQMRADGDLVALLQTLEWAHGAKKLAKKANELLETYDKTNA